MIRPAPETDWERRKALPALSTAEIEARLGPVAHWQLLGGGLANATVQVTLPDGQRVVLRIYLRDRSSCTKEAALLRRFAGVLPVPRVLGEGEDHLLLSLEPGEALVTRLHERRGDPRAMGLSAGALLARLHSEEQPAAGFLDADLTVPEPWTSLAEVWSDYLHQLLSGPAGQRLGPDRSTALRALDPPTDGRVVLCHGDYKPTNLLSDARHITAVLDWEFAFAGHPGFDLGQLLRWSDRVDPAFEQGVVEGYGALPDDWRPTALKLDLVNLLSFLDGPDRPRLQADCLERVERTLGLV